MEIETEARISSETGTEIGKTGTRVIRIIMMTETEIATRVQVMLVVIMEADNMVAGMIQTKMTTEETMITMTTTAAGAMTLTGATLAEVAHALQAVENTADLTRVPTGEITEIIAGESTTGMTGTVAMIGIGGIKQVMKYPHGLAMRKQSAGVRWIN